MMMNVVDASVLIAASAEDDAHREWAVDVIGGRAAAPHVMPVEVASALRRLEASGALTAKASRLALRDALELDVELLPFAPFAGRVWELRGAVTACDAWYVALAEALDVPLATLDARLMAAPGPRCTFLTPGL